MNKTIITVLVAVLFLGIVGVWYQSNVTTELTVKEDVQVSEQEDVTNTEDDEFAGTDFEVKGFVGQLSVPSEGRGYYYQLEESSRIFFALDVQFTGEDIGHMQMSGGDLYEMVDADIDSFSVLKSPSDVNYWAKDKEKVYYRGTVVEGVDVASFDLNCTSGDCVYEDDAGNKFDAITADQL